MTLIEVLMYIGLFALMMSSVFPLFSNINLWESDAKKLNNATNEYVFLREKIRSLTKLSNQVLIPLQGATSTNFRFDTENIGIENLEQAAANQPVLTNEEAGEQTALTSTDTPIDALQFFQSQNQYGAFQRLSFETNVNGYDFGTTTFIFRDE